MISHPKVAAGMVAGCNVHFFWLLAAPHAGLLAGRFTF
jgi:hypothetical protein